MTGKNISSPVAFTALNAKAMVAEVAHFPSVFHIRHYAYDWVSQSMLSKVLFERGNEDVVP